jgi:hypothetical protein
MKQQAVKSIKLDSCPGERVTAFGGMAVAHRLLLRMGVWPMFGRLLPQRRGYSMEEVVVSAITGLLTGARGTFATEVVRKDPALLSLMGLSRAPEEATFWRALQDVGEAREQMSKLSLSITRQAVSRAPRRAIYEGKWLPVFIDGTLLEGSGRREGTKWIREKGEGLMWTVGFVGPYAADQVLCGEGEGEGEITAARTLIKRIDGKLLEPQGLRKDALVLMDSLHGNDATLTELEKRELCYIVGVKGLTSAEKSLDQQPECQWLATPEYDAARGVEDSAVCTAWLQCEEWPEKRLIVGRRWRRKGEFVWNYAAVATNIAPGDKRLGKKAAEGDGQFARAIWRLYNRKGACENHFKNLLRDLRLHNPPCQEWIRNAGFYAIGALTGLIASAIDVLTSPVTGRRRSIATLRRWLFAVPARVRVHARTARVTILGLTEWWHGWIDLRFRRAARC